jgi:hypothetical protein
VSSHRIKAQLFFVGFICVLTAFFFGVMLTVINDRSASAAPYFEGQTLFEVNGSGITVFGQTYYWP